MSKLRRNNSGQPYDAGRKNDFTRDKFIVEKLPEYFGVKAVQQQLSVVKGRHPNSLKKDDELWHYSRVSSERHKLIKGGKGFWGAIEQSTKQHNIPQTARSPKSCQGKSKKFFEEGKEDENNEEDDDNNFASTTLSLADFQFPSPNNNKRPGSPNSPPGTAEKRAGTASTANDPEKSTFKGASLQAQLKSALSKSSTSDLNFRVDFSNRSLIHYNMIFMIMNYNNEVIYVDRNNEMRVKHISQIKSTDRLRFKMVNLSNPSNPSTIQFGDNMWLQIADNIDSIIDTTFQTGSVLISKLFISTDVKGVTFEQQNFKSSSSFGSAAAQAAIQQLLSQDALMKQLMNNRKLKVSKAMSMLTYRPQLSNAPSMASIDLGSLSVTHDDIEDDNHSTGTATNIPDEISKRKGSVYTPANQKKNLASFNNSRLDGLATANREEYLKRTRICGHVETCRIVDVKKMEQLAESTFLSDDKASRYIARTSLHLGKWSIESGIRFSDKNRVQQYFFNPLSGTLDSNNEDTDNIDYTKTSTNNDSIFYKDMIKSHILSLTPIVIQQDAYLLSSATTEEFRHWPENSSSIIESANFLNETQKYECEETFQQFIKNQSRFDFLDMGTKGLRRKKNDPRPNTAPANDKNNSSSNTSNNVNQDGYCCLRRIVKQNAPYEFAVDRRSVWRLCLFEQFSDNYMQSEREKEVKRVMETATMVLKLSKMNREGGTVHIESEGIDNLPSLVSGEDFPRRLREITFKLQQKRNSEFLSQRRINEGKIHEYFHQRISNVLEEESTGFKTSREGLRSAGRSLAEPSLNSINSPKIAGGSEDGYDYDDVGSHTQFSLDGPTSSQASLTSLRSKQLPSSPSKGQSVRFQNSMISTLESPSASQVVQEKPSKSRPATALPSLSSLKKDLPSRPTHPPGGERLFQPSVSYDSYAGDLPSLFIEPSGSQLLNNEPSALTLPRSLNASTSNFSGVAASSASASIKNQLPPRPKTGVCLSSKHYSEEIKKVFDTSIVPPYEKKLLLTNSTALHEFEDLSSGEQLLSFHKTFRHINRAAKVSFLFLLFLFLICIVSNRKTLIRKLPLSNLQKLVRVLLLK
jgi:hypothetical protein